MDHPDAEEKINVCPIPTCNRAFATQAGLRQHWSKSHSSEEINELIAEKTRQSQSQTPVQLDSSSVSDTYLPTVGWNRLQVLKEGNDGHTVTLQQFDIIDNAAAGDCLFLAVLEFLQRNNCPDVPKTTTELRLKAVDYILIRDVEGRQTNFDRFKDNLVSNLQNEISTLSATNATVVSDESLKEDYSNYMSTPGNYGTICELCAIAELFDFEFNIIRRNSQHKFSSYDYGSASIAITIQPKPVVHLLFTGDVSRGHFQLLLPVEGSGTQKTPPGTYDLVADYSSSRLISIALARPVTLRTAQSKVPDSLASSKSSAVNEFKCKTCGRRFDTERGLNVHRNVHQNESNPVTAHSNTDECNFEDFVVLLARCRSNIHVLKRVPRGARMTAANKLSQCIEECLASPLLEKSWKNLLTFAYSALRVPERTKNTSLSTLVKRNIEKRELTIPIRRGRKKVPISLSRRIEYKISEGNVKGAVKILSSTDTLAPQTLETFAQLKDKHLPPSRELRFPDPPNKNAETLTVSERDVFFSIKSFQNGSGSGIDGLLPQHLKDLTLPSVGDAGLRLLKSITGLTNYMLSGKVQSKFIEIMYGASLCALEKKQGGIRPIAVGNTFRRITSKLSSASVRSDMAKKFAPRQIGFGIQGGCEAAAHATRTFIKKNAGRNVVVIKIDFRNAFNEVDRDVFLHEMKIHCPLIFPYLMQCYASPTLLFYGDFVMLSLNGAQQGDPCGPLVFSSAIQAVIEALVSEFVVFYLDDGTIAGKYDSVLSDFETVIEQCAKIGLQINPSKCELYFCSGTDRSVVEQFNILSPGICVVNDLTLLGAPISDNAFDSIFRQKLSEMKLLFERLSDLDSYHVAFYILKNCFAIPKLVFLLRTTLTWKHDDAIEEVDNAIKSAVESLTNSKLNMNQWINASLPVNSGGIGVRRVKDVALPAFLSSANAVSPLVSTLLQHPTLQVEEIADYEDGLQMWNRLHPECVQPERPTEQRQWNKITVDRLVNNLSFVCDEDKARFLASRKPESGAWLQALPSRSIGTLLDNNAFRIIIGLRLGSDICEPHICPCGALVDKKGLHPLKCRKSTGRYARHAEMNSTIKRALTSVDVPAKLEPVGLVREDGKRVDGMTLIPWSKGSVLIWDATCTDTTAPSNMRFSIKEAGKAADVKAQAKTRKYRSLIDQNYHFVPFAVETMGPWSSDAIEFFDILSKMIVSKTQEPRSKSYLQQRLSMAIQRGNAAAVMGSFRSCDKMNEIFYIL